MKLSARSRYATRILLELAKEKSDAPMSASTLSQHTGVSVQFVEQILKPLKQKGLTSSVRGAAGGHKLARSAKDITLAEIVRLMEGGIKLTVCSNEKANVCPRQSTCLTRQAWVSVSNALERELEAITLDSLLHGGSVCITNKTTLAQPAVKKAPTAAQQSGAKRPRPSAPPPPPARPAREGLRRVKGLRPHLSSRGNQS